MAKISSKISNIEAVDEQDDESGSDKILPAPPEAPSTAWVWWLGLFLILFWIVSTSAVFYGFYDLGRTWQDMAPTQIAAMMLAVLAPALLKLVLTFTISRIVKLSAEAKNMAYVSQLLTAPDETLEKRTAIMSQKLRQHVGSVDSALTNSLNRLEMLEDAMLSHEDSLRHAQSRARKQAEDIRANLSDDRQALQGLLDQMDTSLAGLKSRMETFQAVMSQENDTAVERARESRERLDQSINALKEVVETLDDRQQVAVAALSTSGDDIRSLGDILGQRGIDLENIYKKHAAALTDTIAKIREEQDDLAKDIEARLSRMELMAHTAQDSAKSLVTASEAGKLTVDALGEAAKLADSAVKQRFAEMEDMVRFSSHKAEDISERAARRVRTSLTTTREEIAQIERDMLALESRLRESARRSVDISETPAASSRPNDQTELRTAPQPKDNPEDVFVLRQIVPDEAEDTPSRGWRNLISNVAKPDIEQMMSDRFVEAELPPLKLVSEDVVRKLSNIRAAKGAIAMKSAASKELENTRNAVRKLLEKDKSFRDLASKFSTDYSRKLAAAEGHSDALFFNLETEAGRAYLLLCAAQESGV